MSKELARVLLLDPSQPGDGNRPWLDTLIERAHVTLVSGPSARPERQSGLEVRWFDRYDDSVGTLIRRLHRAEPFDAVVVVGIDDEWRSAVNLDGPAVILVIDATSVEDPRFEARCGHALRADATVLVDAGSTADAVLAAAPGLDVRLRVTCDPEAAATAIVQLAEQKPAVLVLTPSADLYGSDQALLDALPGLVSLAPITVLSASHGPFVSRAREAGASVVVTRDFAARRRFLEPAHLAASFGRWIGALLTVARLTRRLNVGLTYVNTVAVPIMPALRAATRRPVLVHVHERALGGRLEAFAIRWAVEHGADRVVANSAWTASTLSRHAQSKTDVVHNGVAVTDNAISGPATKHAPECMRLICVARLHPKKGQAILLKALAQVVADGCDVTLDLLGDALDEHRELEDELHRLTRTLGLADRVVFHGYVDDPDPYYRAADVVVVPSVRPEEFSLVAAEGQMRGLAAVVTGPGGVCEVVADQLTGIVVAPNDVAELSSALRTLAEQPDRRAAMGAAGRIRMIERFSTQRYRDNLASVVAAALEA